MVRTLPLVLALGGALLLSPTRAAAQASPYVPLDDAAYAYLDALQARGRLPGLNGLERPYTVAAVSRALAAAGTAEGVVGAWLTALRNRVARLDPAHTPDAGGAAAGDGAALLLAVAARGTAESTTRRELMLADDAAGAHPGGQLRVAGAVGNLAVGARYVLDQRWADDPDYGGFNEDGVAGRVEEGYVAGRWRYGELFFGRMDRSWGPAPLPGLQLGGEGDSFDHLLGRVGTPRLHLATLVARLDDTPGLHAPRVQRWLVGHRVGARLGALELAATETMVYSGPERGLEPSLVNPLAPLILTHYNEDQQGNVTFGAEALWRAGWGTVGVQGMLDDYQFEDEGEATEEPPSYGVTVTAEGLPLWGEHRWFASYTRVANLTYRSAEPGDNHVWQGVGLGRAFADHDEARLGVELALLPAAPVRLYVAHRRQGEGDYRRPFPPIEDYDVTPSFLSGQVARVTRVGVASAGALGGLSWRLDAGYNRVTGAGAAIAGARRQTALAESGLVGRLTLVLEPGVLRHRLRPE